MCPRFFLCAGVFVAAIGGDIECSSIAKRRLNCQKNEKKQGERKFLGTHGFLLGVMFSLLSPAFFGDDAPSKEGTKKYTPKEKTCQKF